MSKLLIARQKSVLNHALLRFAVFSKCFAQRNVFVPLISDEQLALADKDCNFNVHKRSRFRKPRLQIGLRVCFCTTKHCISRLFLLSCRKRGKLCNCSAAITWKRMLRWLCRTIDFPTGGCHVSLAKPKINSRRPSAASVCFSRNFRDCLACENLIDAGCRRKAKSCREISQVQSICLQLYANIIPRHVQQSIG